MKILHFEPLSSIHGVTCLHAWWLLCGCYARQILNPKWGLLMNLTKRQIDKALTDGDQPMFLWDGTIKGFGVKIMPSGTKRYVFKYRSSGGGRRAIQRWYTFGTHGEMPFEEVREYARQLSAAVGRGEDPQGQKMQNRQAPLMRDAWERFEREHLPKRKLATRTEYHSAWVNKLEPRLGKMKVCDVARADIDRLHKAISKTAPFMANRVLSVLSKMMNLSESWGWREQGTNPCKFVEKNPEQKRERYLSATELGRLGQAMQELVDLGMVWPEIANLFKLLLLTGARKNEIATCKWAWVDIDNCVIHLPDSKTGAKPIFLSQSAVTILQSQKVITRNPDSEFVFPGGKYDGHIVNLAKPWHLICKHAKIENVRIHDLRHTAASIAVGQGVPLPIIGRLLGHSQSQTTARYAHVDSDPALAAANLLGNAIMDKL